MKSVVVIFLCIFSVTWINATKDIIRKKKAEIIIKGKRESTSGSYLPPSRGYLPPPPSPSNSYLPPSGGSGTNVGHQNKQGQHEQQEVTYIIASGLDNNKGGFRSNVGRYSGGFGGSGKVTFVGHGGAGHSIGGHGVAGHSIGGRVSGVGNGYGKIHTIAVPVQTYAAPVLGLGRSVGIGHGGFGGSFGGHSSLGSLGGSYGGHSGGFGGHSGGFGGHSGGFGGHSGGFGGHSAGFSGHPFGSLEIDSIGGHSLGGGVGSHTFGSSLAGHSLGGLFGSEGHSLGGSFGGHSVGSSIEDHSFGGGSLDSGLSYGGGHLLSGEHSFSGGQGPSFGSVLSGGLGSFGKSYGDGHSIAIPSGSYGVPLATPINTYLPAVSIGGDSHSSVSSGSSGISTGYQTPVYAAGHKGLRHYSSDGESSSVNIVESKPVAVTGGSSNLHTNYISSGQTKAPFRPSVFLGATHESAGTSQHYGSSSQNYGTSGQGYSSSSSSSQDYSGGSSQEYETPSHSYGVPSHSSGASSGNDDGNAYEHLIGGNHVALHSAAIGTNVGQAVSNAYLPPIQPNKGYLPPTKGYLPPSASYGIPTAGSISSAYGAPSYNSFDYSSSSASSSAPSHGHH